MDALEFDVCAEATFGDEFARGTAQPGRAEVAGGFDELFLDELLVGFDEQFLGVGVADLDRGAVFSFGVLCEVLARETRAAEAVAARRVTDENEFVPRFLCDRGDESLFVGQADAGDVDERIAS